MSVGIRATITALVLTASAAGSIVLGGDVLLRRNGPARLEPRERLEHLPLAFVENRGQLDPRAGFSLQRAGTSVYFTDAGLRMNLGGTGNIPAWNLALDFVGARTVPPDGLVRNPGVVSYFTGNAEDWHTGVPTYSRVAYRDLWPGIDLVYSGTGSHLKYSFLVHPGGDPSSIRLMWRGADELSLDSRGKLHVSTPVRTLTDDAPVSFQQRNGRRVEVPTTYRLDGRTYGFVPGSYDPHRRLVIDPAMLLSAGYIGGAARDIGDGIALDGAGAMYVTGTTFSTHSTFPETVGPDLVYNGGAVDAFVAKVDPSGTSLAYAGFIGGSGDESGTGIAVDSAGAAYVVGATDSTEGSFPVTGGPDLDYNGGSADAFVAKVAPSGTSLEYAGYIGGISGDFAFGVAVDGSGAAYLTGIANSDEATFPETVGPELTHDGNNEVFVAKVAPSGASLEYAGYIGGTGADRGRAIAVDGSGAAYVTGFTSTDDGSFPVNGGPDLSANGGTGDAFVAKVSPSGASLEYSGFVGGDESDAGTGVAVDGTGAAYLTGETRSPEATFPVTMGPDLTHNGDLDIFVAKVLPSGTSLAQAGYIGGDDVERGGGIAVDGSGAAYVAGSARSTEATFPVKVGPDLTHNGGTEDAVVAEVTPSGTGLVYAGYIGGAGDDVGGGIAVDGTGAVSLVGSTTSTEATFPVLGGPDLSYNDTGDFDAFVARVDSAGSCQGTPVTLVGSDGKDVLTGTEDIDVVTGLGGRDVIKTLGGNDLICAGDGKDTANGGSGKDKIRGDKGKDRLNGGGGRDTLNGGKGKDTCIGGSGKDKSRKCEKEKKIP
jgi:hypothetical protein